MHQKFLVDIAPEESGPPFRITYKYKFADVKVFASRQITAFNELCFDQAKKKIVAFLSEKVVTKTKQDDIVAELEENDLFDIYQDALKYKATVDYE